MTGLDDEARKMFALLKGPDAGIPAELMTAAMLSAAVYPIRYCLEDGRDGFHRWMEEEEGTDVKESVPDEMLEVTKTLCFAVSMQILREHMQ